MKSRDFVYWLQGFAELNKNEPPDETQWKIIRNHLNLVFKHEIDPSMPDPDGELQDAHDGVEHPRPPFRPYGGPTLKC